jgi:hypothetical protein
MIGAPDGKATPDSESRSGAIFCLAGSDKPKECAARPLETLAFGVSFTKYPFDTGDASGIAPVAGQDKAEFGCRTLADFSVLWKASR